MKLGVNVDHVATLRQTRGTRYPNPVAAAILAEKGGADQITVHLREDRRHIQDEDVIELRKSINTELNLEMAALPKIIEFALKVKPDRVTIVPEKRQEITTERGLLLNELNGSLGELISLFHNNNIQVSLFIDPEEEFIAMAKELKADQVEIHTGFFADAAGESASKKEMARLKVAAKSAASLGFSVAAGHGVNYENIDRLTHHVPEFIEYNIGHSIVSRAIFIGMDRAVKEMKEMMEKEGVYD